jgi:hypothetical protein
MAGGAVVVVELQAIGGACGGESFRGKAPLLFVGDLLLDTGCAKACEIRNQIVASLIVKERTVRGHDGRAAHLSRIVEVHFEPERGATRANV